MTHWKQGGWVSQAAASSSDCSAKAAQGSTTPCTAPGQGNHRRSSLLQPRPKAKLYWDSSLVLKTLGIITGDGCRKDNVSGILGEAEQQCVGALFLGRAWHQGTWQSSCTGFRQCCPPLSFCFTQSLGIGVELYLPRGHPTAFLGLNEQVIIRYLVSKQC